MVHRPSQFPANRFRLDKDYRSDTPLPPVPLHTSWCPLPQVGGLFYWIWHGLASTKEILSVPAAQRARAASAPTQADGRST